MQGAEAATANLNSLDLAVKGNGLLVDVSLEPRLGMAVGVADVVAGHSGFLANLALHGRIIILKGACQITISGPVKQGADWCAGADLSVCPQLWGPHSPTPAAIWQLLPAYFRWGIMRRNGQSQQP